MEIRPFAAVVEEQGALAYSKDAGARHEQGGRFAGENLQEYDSDHTPLYLLCLQGDHLPSGAHADPSGSANHFGHSWKRFR